MTGRSTGRMRIFALVAVTLVLAGTAVWDAWALESRSPTHDDRGPAVELVPAAVVATVAEARPFAPFVPLLALGAALVLALAYLARRAPAPARASYPASRRLVRAGRRAPPRAPQHALVV